jgi:flagellar biosynthetic protein FliP
MKTKTIITTLLATLPGLALAQSSPLNINVGTDLLTSQHLFQIIALTTLLSVAPSLLLMITSFTRLVVVDLAHRQSTGGQWSDSGFLGRGMGAWPYA